MTTNRLPDGTTLLLVALCLALVAVPIAATQDSATLSLSSAEAESASDTVTVTLAADGSDVAGYQANVTFDPSVVQVQRVSGADYSDPVQNVDNEAGWVFLTQSQANGVDDPQLATITFEVVGSAGERSTLSFVESDTRVNDAAGAHVDVSLDSGTVSVADGAGVTAHGDGSQATADGGGEDPAAGTANQQVGSGTATPGGAAGGNGTGLSTPMLVGGAAALLAGGVLLGRRAS
ncbi:cohesin domain-containing protein [Haloarchaeobius iranensis]|uniref:Cohesin domain-containing protein n=1 Tax=Haloarchaeobius iranensis TaxID=996166 RepID=A0A1G9SBX7_9EURY|nr:cohesin domain-containing protein [Haloarchaeobius iranensis]SDM33003.1 Cohesin domain-containing protein [Haloarchaeobius iranensis]